MKIKYRIEKKENKKNIALIIEKEYCIEKKNIVLKKKRNIVMKKKKKEYSIDGRHFSDEFFLLHPWTCQLLLLNKRN